MKAVHVQLVGPAFDVQDAGVRPALARGGNLADEQLALVGVL
jgi:hypothetical protein